jgi:3-hydroxybutyryl-CoA dehydrogenase
MTIEEIRTFSVLGAGTLGLRVGLQAAISGFDTIIFDINPDSLEAAKKNQEKILALLVKKHRLPEQELEAVRGRIHFTSNAEVAANCDLINESVTEDLQIKKAVWKQFGKLCPPHTLFTTNTSYLLPSMMAVDTGRPGLFCAFHFHDVFQANVVDIMPHAGTESWVPELLAALGRKLNQTPVIVRKESPGYIFNAMLLALIGAAGALVTSEVASVEDVDRSWMGNFKTDSGPFGILDAIGLDTAWHVTRNLPDEKSRRFAELLKSYINAGKFGVKNGEGFYRYPNPLYSRPGFVQGS